MLLMPGHASALDLLQAFDAAQRHDAQLNSARLQLAAAQERLPQAQAALRPAIAAVAAANAGRVDTDVAAARSFDNVNGGINFSYPLYSPADSAVVDQSRIGVRLAEAQLGLAGQDLITRVATAYFDVLSAQDAVEVAEAQRRAISEQFESAKRNFEVGTATVTDQQEAQARLDLNAAQLAAAGNELTVRNAALAQLTGLPTSALNTLKLEVPLPGARPNDIENWTARARAASYAVQQAELTAAVARLDIDRARYARWPVVDLVSQATLLRGKTAQGLSSAANGSNTISAGIQLSVPLYAGGGLQARERETVAALQASESDLENSRRLSDQNARQAFLGLKSSAEQARALEAAVKSSRLALESNLLGYQVGVRINVDVLNAQQQLFSTLRDLARARYDVLLNDLRLRSIAGALVPADVAAVNSLLSPPTERNFPTVTGPGAVRGSGAAAGATRGGRGSGPVVPRDFG
ncbi:MAG TPA: TolC family outer membrane protein, partial [Lautropia sp.]|nr:TolC family outer membrane protein [Lautropia sp.]